MSLFDEFDDYNFKDNKHRLLLSLKQKKEKSLSPWQLSKFLNSLNTYYYKQEVINTISIAINHGFEPENIFILDQSFKFDFLYEKLSTIEILDLKNLYTIGKPTSLFPNLDLIYLNKLFYYHRKINEALYKNKIRPTLNNKFIGENFKAYLEHGSEIAITKLREEVLKLIAKINDLKIKEKIENEMQNRINTFHKELQLSTSEIEQIKLKSDILLVSNTKLPKNDLFLKQKYYQKFFTIFHKMQRPVACIFDRDSQKVKILCRAHINKKEVKNVTLDLKSISHNSPLDSIILGGLGLLSTIAEEKRRNALHEYDMKIRELELERAQVELDTAKGQKKEQFIRTKLEEIRLLKEIHSLLNDNEKNPISNIQNEYLKNNLDEQNLLLNQYARSLLSQYKFEVDIPETKISDVTGNIIDIEA